MVCLIANFGPGLGIWALLGATWSPIILSDCGALEWILGFRRDIRH